MVGDEADLFHGELTVGDLVWADDEHVGDVMVQCSAHGAAQPAELRAESRDGTVHWRTPQRRVAPGQSVVFFDDSDRYVLGGGYRPLTPLRGVGGA